MSCFIPLVLIGFFVTDALASIGQISVDQRRMLLKNQHASLLVEVVAEDLVHFELSTGPQDLERPLYTTPMVYNTKYSPASIQWRSNGVSTRELDVEINPDNLCVSTRDKIRNKLLVQNCPLNLHSDWKGITLDMQGIRNLYGLGNYFMEPGTADGDWVGRVWDPTPHSFGNSLRPFHHGATSYAQFPILYALGEGEHNFALFLDQVYKQMWSFNSSPWRVEMSGDQIRWYVIAGPNVRDIRRDYLKLTGMPPLPPKKTFGLWVSEFGFDNWAEAYRPVVSLRQNGFPLDGLGMDLQWFGGVFYERGQDTRASRMGTLNFDLRNFPNFEHEVQHLRKERGVNLMLIEESYVSRFLDGSGGRSTEWLEMAQRGALVRQCPFGDPIYLDSNPWWGVGGMIDWTNPSAGDYWHDRKRQPLYRLGITDHWTDLGEPEMFDANGCYHGFPEIKKHTHRDVHNIYNLRWVESIARGYERNNNRLRPYIMARSGTSGIQRFGAGMWSGDIAANMGSLAAHYRVHGSMTMSGVDYFSSDVGGFHRRPDTLDGDANELFTQWLANAALFDFPVRSHVWNISNQLQTSPDKIGDLKSNRFNVHLRYKLLPYYYSLAYMAHKNGEPLVPPVFYYFQNDLNVRLIGNQKMIGPFLMAGMVAKYGEKERSMYFPKGKWINFYNDEVIQSQGQSVARIATTENAILRLPLFARSGAIVPMMYVDNKTMNVAGWREGEPVDQSLRLRVYPDPVASKFTLYEDDGETVDYKTGKYSLTALTQIRNGKSVQITIGTQTNGPAQRESWLEVVVPGETAAGVRVGGQAFPKLQDERALNSAGKGWVQLKNKIVIRTGAQPSQRNKEVILDLN